ncbi:MAG: hypothetical protein A2X86_08910 [Bdellovibrionales bacterium GWA2_49_15]|nr:MAG: hypothetical protein A2X86_08910 [Bdellovibrionales bacterium GWA2_49_15]HAZ12897.1 hypothetical protein [Bdellovibrionales bacterium]
MKTLITLVSLLCTINIAHASCVNWTQVWSCENSAATLTRGQSWCGGQNKSAYSLNINKAEAVQHLSQVARVENSQITNLALETTQKYGQFLSKLNSYVTSVATENHDNGSLKVEMFLDTKKLGEYIFYNCTF